MSSEPNAITMTGHVMRRSNSSMPRRSAIAKARITAPKAMISPMSTRNSTGDSSAVMRADSEPKRVMLLPTSVCSTCAAMTTAGMNWMPVRHRRMAVCFSPDHDHAGVRPSSHAPINSPSALNANGCAQNISEERIENRASRFGHVHRSVTIQPANTIKASPSENRKVTRPHDRRRL